MNRLQTRVLVAVIAVFAAATIGAGSLVAAAPTGLGQIGQPRSISDEKLLTQFFDLLREKDLKSLAKYLSPAFVLQRSNGTTVTKAAYLANPSTVNSVTLHDVGGTHTRDVRVIHAVVSSDTVIEGQPVQSTNSPRLATYVWNGKRWQLTSYANFAPIP